MQAYFNCVHIPVCRKANIKPQIMQHVRSESQSLNINQFKTNGKHLQANTIMFMCINSKSSSYNQVILDITSQS